MHPYNATPKCPRCGKSVYLAEQVMGPGRRLYHKPCLACTACNKRLDSFTLLEHDQEPYCKQCHNKNFGTRDLRQANLPHRAEALIPPEPFVFPTSDESPLKPHLTGLGPSESPSAPSPSVVPPPKSSQEGAEELTEQEKEEERDTVSADPMKSATAGVDLVSPTNTGRGRFGLPRTVPLNLNLAPTRSGLSPTRDGRQSPTRPAQSGLLHRATQSLDSSAFTSSPAALGRSNSDATSRPLPPPLAQTSTGTRYGRLLTGGPASPTKRWTPATNLICPRCEKSVYFAEQVKAIGKTFHKACLRCVQCGTTLDSTRLTEREGQPYCHRCYSKSHGPAGSGYALLGKAGG